MSGPKKSSYEIKQEIREAQARERQRKRKNQIDKIEGEIRQYQSQLNNLAGKYGAIASNVIDNANRWLNDVRRATNGDLRDCWRGLKGVGSYLSKQEQKLSKIKKRNDIQVRKEREAAEKRQIEEEQKALHQAKIDIALESINSVTNEYKEILNDGIRQRIDIFSKSIRANPDNPNTLKQIEEFKSQLSKQYEEYLRVKNETLYVAETLSRALGADVKEGSDGILTVAGTIEGVDISVKLHPNNNDIDMDTPLDGSCKQGLNALTRKLGEANIDLGAIKVLNSGQVWNAVANQNRQQKVRS